MYVHSNIFTKHLYVAVAHDAYIGLVLLPAESLDGGSLELRPPWDGVGMKEVTTAV